MFSIFYQIDNLNFENNSNGIDIYSWSPYISYEVCQPVPSFPLPMSYSVLFLTFPIRYFKLFQAVPSTPSPHELFVTIPYLSYKIFQAVPWYLDFSLFMSLGKISVENLHTDTVVRFIEVITNIPSNLSILPPLLDDSVEESQYKYQCWEGWMWTF